MISIMITTSSLNSQEMISQVNVYVMEGGQYSAVLYGFVKKTSLRICYIILFQCKSP